MINLSSRFLSKVKKTLKQKGLKNNDYIVCFIYDVLCNKIQNHIIQSLELKLIEFYNKIDRIKNSDYKKESIGIFIIHVDYFKKNEMTFNPFLFFKKNGLLISSNVNAFLHLINKRITIDKNGNIIFLNAPIEGKYSLCNFIGDCISEQIKRENLTKKEMAKNLKMSIYKLNSICQGKNKNINLNNMINISFELKGYNKISKRLVIVEKIKKTI